MNARSTVAEMFSRLVDATRSTGSGNGRHRPVTVIEAPDPARIRAVTLGEWASEPQGAQVLDWLAATASDANAQAHRLVGTASGAWWLGYEAGLRDVRAEIAKWRGQPAGTPPARPA